MSENQLINLCKSGDRKGQKQLYDTYSGQMFSICLRYCKDRASATDALQNGFIRVFQNIHQFQGTGSLGGWIRKIIVNASLNEIRKNKRHIFVDIEDIDERKHQNNAFNINIDQYDHDRILLILDQLPQGYKTIFSMSVIDELSHKEISTALNITESTSRSQLMRARKMMRELVSRDPYLNEQYLNNINTHIA